MQSKPMRYRSVILSVLLCGTGVSLGCANDTTGPTPIDPEHGYWQLTLNHHAITLALTPPYNTLQLVATPSTVTGAPVTDSGAMIWTVSDSTSLHISPTGLLTAIAPTAGATLTVRHTIGRVTKTDVAVVNVNVIDQVPTFATLTLQPSSGTLLDTLLVDLGVGRRFIPSALDLQGDTIANVVFSVVSATPTVLLSPLVPFTQGVTGFFNRISAGHALMIAEATVYGVRRVDSLPMTVGWSHYAVVGVRASVPAGRQTSIGIFGPANDTIAVGGVVFWKNELPRQPADVIFDDPTAAQPVDSATVLHGLACGFERLCIPSQGGGNIAAFAPLDTGALRGLDTLGVRARRFSAVGTYHYHSALYGTSGVIHVLPEFQVP